MPDQRVPTRLAALPLRKEAAVPGEPGIWFFVFGDLAAFGLLFVVFVHARAAAAIEYARLERSNNLALGVANTILLLTGSYFVATAVRKAREGSVAASTRLLTLSLACGLGFVIIKGFEWNEKFRHSVGVHTNDFFMYYFMMTGIHLVHTLVALAILVYVRSIVKRGIFSPETMRSVEVGGIFWHLIDALWILIFALLYLMDT